jgi:hypothetical protein
VITSLRLATGWRSTQSCAKPFSRRKFPANREKYREFCGLGPQDCSRELSGAYQGIEFPVRERRTGRRFTLHGINLLLNEVVDLLKISSGLVRNGGKASSSSCGRRERIVLHRYLGVKRNRRASPVPLRQPSRAPLRRNWGKRPVWRKS